MSPAEIDALEARAKAARADDGWYLVKLPTPDEVLALIADLRAADNPNTPGRMLGVPRKPAGPPFADFGGTTYYSRVDVAKLRDDAERLHVERDDLAAEVEMQRARVESEGTAERMGACQLLRTVRDEYTNAAKMWQDHPVEQQRHATVAAVLHNAAMAVEKGAHRRMP